MSYETSYEVSFLTSNDLILIKGNKKCRSFTHAKLFHENTHVYKILISKHILLIKYFHEFKEKQNNWQYSKQQYCIYNTTEKVNVQVIQVTPKEYEHKYKCYKNKLLNMKKTKNSVRIIAYMLFMLCQNEWEQGCKIC